ncbi:uncharacterized protein LOC113233989, partial [Hyposmocoma kahamanoa]|uniref:uncharacterized protein LOC113233989 n=1 Tax=Hyposmocoma kahamanoa TaxID=1477025 RepID=UPI000E6D5EBB
ATTPLPLSPMIVSLLAIAALLCTGVCGVITALYRRHVARQQCDKHPPSSALYLERTADSLSKQDSSNTYCESPKLDYTQYEMKVEGTTEIESDPDIIPCHYEKRPLEFTSISTPVPDSGVGEVHRMYTGHCMPPSVIRKQY